MYKPVLGSQILEKLLKIFGVCDIILAYNIKKAKNNILQVVCRSFAVQNCPSCIDEIAYRVKKSKYYLLAVFAYNLKDFKRIIFTGCMPRF